MLIIKNNHTSAVSNVTADFAAFAFLAVGIHGFRFLGRPLGAE